MRSSFSFFAKRVGRQAKSSARRASVRRSFFENLEDRRLLVCGTLDIPAGAAAPNTITATDASNAIGYVVGERSGNAAAPINGQTTAQVSIDGVCEEFGNRSTLTIEALGGQDNISLNNASTASGLTAITVNGGEQDDHLLVTDVDGNSDVQVTNTQVLTAQTVPVTYSNVESMTIDGVTGNHNLQYTLTNAVETTIVTPSAALDEGSVISDALIPLTYRSLGVGGRLRIDNAAGGADTLIVRGAGIDDGFSVTASGGTGTIAMTASGATRTPIETTSITNLVLEGGDGDDVFSLSAAGAALPYTTTRISGGDPSASDVVTLTGDNSAITVTMNADNSVTVTGGGLGTVTLAGIEIINLNAGSGAVTFNGTAGVDEIVAAPIDTDTIRMEEGATGPAVFTTTIAAITVAEGNANDGDTLTVHLTPANETVTVNNSAATGEVTVTAPTTLKGISFTSANIESLRVLGGSGTDTFNVTAGTFPVSIDGGDPIGTSPGDTLNVTAGGAAAKVAAGPDKDEGTVELGSGAPFRTITFDRVESVNINGAGGATIDATNDADEITVIARDNAPANGIRDFTVSINEGSEVQFLEQATLTVNALSGSDNITLRTPAPNNAAWDVDVTINGGAPSADADRLVVETPGQTTAQYTPSAPDTGSVVIAPGGTATNVTINGIEQLIYDGEAGNDALTVFGSAAADVITHTAGTNVDSGQIQVGSNLALNYQNLGATATITADGAGGNDALVYSGDSTDDVFTVSTAGAVDLVTGGANRLDVAQANIEQLRLLGLDGDDSFVINTAAGIYGQGIELSGGNAGADSVTVLASAASTATLDFATGDITNVVGGAVSVAGIESVTLTGTDAVGDQFTVNNYGASSDIQNLVLDGGDTNNTGDNDRIALNLAAGPNTLHFTPGSAATAAISRQEGGAGISITQFNNAATAGAHLLVTGGSNHDTIVISASDDADTFALVDDDANSQYRVSTSSAGAGRVPIGFATASVEALRVLGGGGNDTLAVDNSGGLVEVPDGVFFDGGAGGSDSLQLSGTTAAATKYSPGPALQAGSITQTAGNAMQAITFVGLEPVLIQGTGSGDALTVNGDDSNNTISYTIGPNSSSAGSFFAGDVTGIVSVDANESIEFSNFGTLTLAGQSGDDTFNLNHGTVPTDLTGITTQGGEGSDQLVVHDRQAAATTVSLATSMITAAEAVTVTHNTMESLSVVAGAGAGTNVTVTGSANYTVNPGAAIDEATILTDTLPVHVSGYGTGRTISLTGGAAASDTLTVNGTDADNTFSVMAVGDVLLDNRATINPTSLERLALSGQDGADTFNVAVATSIYSAGVALQGGNAGANQVAITGSAGADTIGLTLGSSSDSLSGVVGGSVDLTNVAHLSVSGAAGTDALSVTNLGAASALQTVGLDASADSTDTVTVTGTANPDAIDVQPASATTVITSAGPASPTVTAVMNAALTSTFSVNGGGGTDHVTVAGSVAADTVTVARDTTTGVTVDANKPVNLSEGSPNTLTVETRSGDDRITVTGTGGPDLTLNTGDGVDDWITLPTTAGSTTVLPGSVAKSGRLSGPTAGTADDVEYAGVERVIIAGTAASDTLVLVGNNEADTFSVAVNNANNEATVSDGPVVRFSVFGNLTLQGEGGDDLFSVAPSGLVAVTAITVSGSTPSASDKLVVRGTAGDDTVAITPTGNDAGTVAITTAPTLTFNTVESVTYNGIGGNDPLTVNGTAGDDIVTVTPQDANSGTVQVNSLVPIDFTNLGTGTLTVAAAAATNDRLVVRATAGDDNLQVATTSGAVTLTSSAGQHTVVGHTGVEQLTLEGLDGDDQFVVNNGHGYTGIAVSGGGPAGADSATLNGSAASAVVATLGGAAPTVTGGGLATVSLTGVETATLNNAAGEIQIAGTAGPDVFSVAPTGADTATVSVNDVAPLVSTNNTGALNVTAAGAGNDQLAVQLTAGDDVVAVNGTSVATTGLKTITYTATEIQSVQVSSGSGSDSFTVTPSDTPVFIDGGDPIGGDPSDRLTLTAGASVTYSQGPESDEGNFLVGTQVVSFDHIETFGTVTGGGTGTLTINATNADNDITITGTSATTFAFSVDDGAGIPNTGFSNVVVNSLSGDDDIDIEFNEFTLTGNVTVNGQAPSTGGGDTLTVRGHAGTVDTAAWSPGGIDSGTLVVSGRTVNANSTEQVIYDGEGDNETLTMTTLGTPDQITHSPSAAGDAGTLAISNGALSRLGIDYVDLGLTGSVVVNGGGNTDTLVQVGTSASDTFTVSSTGLLTVAGRVPVTTSDVEAYTLQGLGGDDTFIITAGSGVVVNVQGDESSNASNTLNYTQASAATLDLGNSHIDEPIGGAAEVNYTGIDTVNVTSANFDLTVEGAATDDTFQVTPLGTNNGSVQANGALPVVNFSGTGTFTVDGLGGNDELTVNGSAAADTIAVDNSPATPTVAITGRETVNHTGFESLAIQGLSGNDAISVTSAAANMIPVFVDGGDPIGAGDALALTPSGAPTFSPGPESDAGGFEITGSSPLSYDHIEAITVNLGAGAGGAATIMGTGDADQITAAGTAANTVDVQVNDGVNVTYQNATNLTLQGKNGDDNIDVDIHVASLGTAFSVDGGLPSTTGDELSVTGIAGAADMPAWTPSSEDDGALALSGTTITAAEIERVVFDGENGGENLTVSGAGRFVHTPHASVDSGHVAVESLLAIEYVNLGAAGTVVANGTGGADTLVALGTDGSDAISVGFVGDNDADIDITHAAGTHVDLLTEAVENYEIRSGTGDDNISVNTTSNVSGTFAVFAGEPGSGSDTLTVADASATAVLVTPNANNSDDQELSGIFANPIAVSGVELIHYNGNASDTLTVDPGLGDNSVTVAGSSNMSADLVTSDSLPDIEFEDVQTFVVDASTVGSDVVTFDTWFLSGAVNTNYQMSGVGTDTLVIQGVDGAWGGNDSYTVTNPATGPVAITDTKGTNVTVTATNTMLGHLRINTLGGDDVVLINVDATNVIHTPITFDGGGSSDELRLTGAPTGATAGVYTPGPAVTEGRLQYTEAGMPAGTMTIDFLNLEPIVDDTAGTLTVFGTDADNAIDYQPIAGGRASVTVDGFERIDFMNKTSLTINGDAGDDVINLNPGAAPTALTTINVAGGNSSTGDVVVVNGTTGTDTIGFTPASHDAATLTGVQSVTAVNASTVESVIINGLGITAGSGDVVTVNTPVGVDSSVEVTPGFAFDSGDVQVDTLVPMSFRNINVNGSLRVVDPDGAGGNDRVTYNGDAASDTFVVPDPRLTAPSIAKIRFIGSVPFLQVAVGTTGIENYTLRGQGGNDTFDITPQAGVNIRTEGDGPANGDVLNLSAEAVAVALNLETSTISQAGFGDVVFSGTEDVNIDANTQDLTVTATAQDDTVEVTPLGTNSGTLQANDRSPVVNFTETGTFNLDTAGGQNTIIVNGSSVGETIAVTGALVTVGTRETINYSATGGGNALTVDGHQGGDTFNVVPDGSVPMFIDGGDPIGTIGDTLALTANMTSVFSPGPEGDEGGYDIDSLQPVSYDHIEAVTVTDPTGNNLVATVMGTQGDDDITGSGVAANSVDVTVNDGPVTRYSGVATMILQGKNGDDDFDIALNVPNLGTVFNIDGGLPSVHADVLTVTAVTGAADTSTWTPSDIDAGSLSVAGQTIAVGNIEQLIYDGQSDDESLAVIGDGSSATNEDREHFVHTPGDAADAGHVAISTVDDGTSSSNESLLGIDYVNLGLRGRVTVNGGSMVDTLVARGTDGDDVLNVSFTGADEGQFDLRSAHSNHIDLFSTAVENYEVRTLEGDDDVNLNAQINASGTFTVRAGGPSGSDTVNLIGDTNTVETVVIAPHATESDDQTVSGLSPNSITLVGVELVTYAGGNSADTLTVDPGLGDNKVRVERGQGADQVTSDSLPTVEFAAVATFAVDGTTGGADIVTFATWFLAGATPANYQFAGNATDTLVIEGVSGAGGGNDNFTVTNPTGAPSVAITDANGTMATVTETTGGLGRLQINTLGGNDQVLVDVGGPASDLVTVPITFDGGASSDLLTISGTPVTTVTDVTYSPGPDVTEGRLTYDNNMTIDFVNLEPVIDLVPAANLVVNGTNAANSIDYRAAAVAGRGLVSVDGFETIEFTNKDQLTLNGNAGDDTFNLDNPALPAGNANASLDVIHVNGGGSTFNDVVIVNGTAAADTVVFSPTAPDAATVTGTQAATRIDIATTEKVVINGLADDDSLAVNTPAGANHVTYTPGPTVDGGDVRVDSLVPMSFMNLGAAGTLSFTDPGGRVDTLVHRGSDVDDVTTVAATTGYVTLTNTPGTHVVTQTDGIQNLTLDGLSGDDIFNVFGLHPYTILDVNGQEPDASDVLNIVGTAGVENAIVNLEPGTVIGFGSAGGEVISHTGVEHVNIDGGGGTGGSDTLTVNGTQDDDVLTYEPLEAEDGKFQNAGSNTEFLFRNIGGDFTVAGGDDGADDVILVGTNGHDVITVNAPTRIAAVEDTSGVTLKPVNLNTTVEDLDVLARDGNDTIHVIPAPPLSSSVDGIPTNLIIDIDGGSPSASDALVIAGGGGANLAATDFVVVNHSRRHDEGVIRVYRDTAGIGNAPTRFPDIGFVDIEVVNAHVDDPAENRLILGPDVYEQNDHISDAQFVGSGQTLNIQDLAIFPPIREHRFVVEDQDWFHFVAESTGTLDFQVYFNAFNPELLPQGGNTYIEVYDSDGTFVAGNGPNFGSNDELGTNVRDDDERVRIPAVSGQSYFLRVFGAPNSPPDTRSTAINGYSITVVNTPPTIPYDVELADIVASSTVATNVAAAAGSISFTAAADGSLSSVDDFYNGKYVYFTSGAQAVHRGVITDYTAATRTFVFDATNFTADPAVADSFVVETHDTGRSQLDNVTRDDTPVIRFRLDDGIFLHDLPGNAVNDSPPDEVIPIPFNTDQTRDTTTAGYRVPVFIEGPPQSAVGQLPQVPVGYARQLAEGVYEFDFERDAIDLNNPNGPTTSFSLASVNGSYFINAKVEIDDPGTPTQFGFGERSQSLEIVVDTSAPPVFFGDPAVANDGLMANSDSGVHGQPATFTDQATNITRPQFWGIAEANSLVMLYADRNANGTVDSTDLFLGETVAMPTDGTNQFPGGQWNLEVNVDLNDPAYFSPQDGLRTILAVSEDLAGNLTPAIAHNIFLDTQGPRVNHVFITSAPNYDLFDPKPSTDGPTPAVTSLTINVEDLPIRSDVDPNFLYPALVEQIIETDGNVSLVGDHNGTIPIQNIDFVGDTVVNGQSATGTIVLTFAAPIPDDRFTLTIFDNVVDPVGNALDGETDTFEPEENPRFPSGDLQPGGDFIARFTIDSRPEIGSVCCGGVYVDINGNFVFDPEGKDNDYTNRDLVFAFTDSKEAIFAGNFAPAGALSASGFDKLGAYGYESGSYRFTLDFDHDGVADFTSVSEVQVNGLPVAGDFDPTHPGDEIGLYDGINWYLDSDGDNVLEMSDTVIPSTMQGLPVVGDFNGDGDDDLATFAQGTNAFFLDFNRDGNSDLQIDFGFVGITERPIAGDLNLDGVDDLGLWVPDRAGQTPEEIAEWYFLVSDSNTGTFNPFSPAPLGNDLFAQFGDRLALPIFGNFDPPVTASVNEEPEVQILTNAGNPVDVNNDGFVTPLDALFVINHLNDPSAQTRDGIYVDVSGSGSIEPMDALLVINSLNGAAEAEGEGGEIVLLPVTKESAAESDDQDAEDDSDVAASHQLVHTVPPLAAITNSSADYHMSSETSELDEILSDVADDVAAQWIAN